VARRHQTAAETRQKPQFCGSVDETGQQLFGAILSVTPPPSAPINIPAGTAERASRDD